MQTSYELIFDSHDGKQFRVSLMAIDSFDRMKGERVIWHIMHTAISCAYETVCRYLCIQYDSQDRLEFIDEAWKVLYRAVFPKKQDIIEAKKREEPKVPEDVADALRISELAMQRQKQILEFESEIKRMQREYYKKHGTFFEKCATYIKSW